MKCDDCGREMDCTINPEDDTRTYRCTNENCRKNGGTQRQDLADPDGH